MKRLAFITAAVASLLMASSVSAGTGQAGRLSIPRLGIYRMPIYVNAAWMDEGPFWQFKHGAKPGQGKVMVIGGHDVTSVPGYGRHGPFYNLVKLKPGDLVVLWWHGAVHKYRVRSRHRWHPYNDYEVVVNRGVEAVWFYCCWPRYTAEGRLWVEADAVKQRKKA